MTIAFGKTLGGDAMRGQLSAMRYAEAKTYPDSASAAPKKE